MSSKDESIERVSETMRLFMARAVLYQDAVARWAGLNSTDLQCVGLLTLNGPATPGELAEWSGLTAGGAITTVIDRLEKAGVVTRDRDPNDRRRVIVSVRYEELGRRVGTVYQRTGERWAEYLATLTVEQIDFANELFATAAQFNADEIERLRTEPRPS